MTVRDFVTELLIRADKETELGVCHGRVTIVEAGVRRSPERCSESPFDWYQVLCWACGVRNVLLCEQCWSALNGHPRPAEQWCTVYGESEHDVLDWNRCDEDPAGVDARHLPEWWRFYCFRGEPALVLMDHWPGPRVCQTVWLTSTYDGPDAQLEWAGCREAEGLWTATVICRSCGPREFLVCEEDVTAILDSFVEDDPYPGPLYCTNTSLSHQIISIAELRCP